MVSGADLVHLDRKMWTGAHHSTEPDQEQCNQHRPCQDYTRRGGVRQDRLLAYTETI